MKVVFVTETRAVPFRGIRVALNQGNVWPADDPVVLEFPDYFTDLPPAVMRWDDVRGQHLAPVEQATAAPGEKRATRR